MGAYLNSRVHATHEMPTPKAFNFYKLKGFRTALNVRHPLGLVKSFAAKGLNHADNQLSDQARAPGSTVHDLATVARLGSPEWLARTARLLDKYYRPISERLESLTTVRFEYALQEPVGYVEDLAACLGLSLSKDSARSLSQIIGTAPLASNHFNSPAVDSWREHFTAADLDVVAATGLFSTFERFGYQPPATEDLKPLSDRRKKIAESLANGAAWHNATLDFRADFVGLMGSFSNDDLFEAFGKDRICTVRVGDFEIIGTDRDIIHEFSARLSARTLDVLDNSSKGSIVKRFF
jgi:hypothetical protein